MAFNSIIEGNYEVLNTVEGDCIPEERRGCGRDHHESGRENRGNDRDQSYRGCGCTINANMSRNVDDPDDYQTRLCNDSFHYEMSDAKTYLLTTMRMTGIRRTVRVTVIFATMTVAVIIVRVAMRFHITHFGKAKEKEMMRYDLS